MRIGNYETHPVADAFPLMDGDAFVQLCADIKQNGLQAPILLYQERIIDGRNRYRGCLEVGVEPDFQEFEMPDWVDDDNDETEALIDFAISMNLRRRHMNETTRSFTCATLSKMMKGRPKKNTTRVALTQSQLADQFGVSEKSIQRAKTVLASAEPEVIAAAKRDEMPLATAAEVSKLRPEVQRDIAARAKAEDVRPLIAKATGVTWTMSNVIKLGQREMDALRALVLVGRDSDDDLAKGGVLTLFRIVPELAKQ